jgi:peptidoglycan-associated lipoprotein
MQSRLFGACAVTALCVSFSGCGPKVRATQTKTAVPQEVARATPAPAATRPEPAETRAIPTPTTRNEPSSMPDATTRANIQDLLNRIQDAYFDYNKHTLRPDAEATLQKDAQTLADIIKQYPDFKLTVEGHCDERGSEEFNLALGDARAKQAKEYLAGLGLPGSQLRTISFGKDKPICADHDEACWQRNRRAHITQEQ